MRVGGWMPRSRLELMRGWVAFLEGVCFYLVREHSVKRCLAEPPTTNPHPPPGPFHPCSLCLSPMLQFDVFHTPSSREKNVLLRSLTWRRFTCVPAAPA
ncbi:hypothetical protein BaRGS_00001474 [Batillaria attramentaria]|uniref:Secreted protein n=1 Tax=Batillaria attramentaria TaxID=370345 RepID=A0ABD0M6X5_9CAEN